MMTLLHWSRLLKLTGSMFWCLAGGALLYLFVAPVKIETGVSNPIRRPSIQDAAPKKELPPLAEFATVWHTPLQRPVFDPPPAAPVQEVKPEPPKLNAKLVATAIDGGVPTAMFRLPSGKFAALKSGESFDNTPGTVKITAIDGKQISLQFEGFDEQIMLEVGK